MLVAVYVFQLQIPWLPMIYGFFFTVISNHWLQESVDREGPHCGTWVKVLIFTDTILLTGLLCMSGGLSNPFVAFYLLLIALAAMTLQGRTLTMLLVVITVEIFVIHKLSIPLVGPATVVESGKLTYTIFLMGWGTSLFLIALYIAFFVHRMRRQLSEREEKLAEAQQQIAEANRFQSLATLAAGVAHELGTPLGTIAIASKDLELSLKSQNASEEWQEDARLIRGEVDRCRQILNRLDQHSTRKTGESPRVCTAALLCRELGNFLSESVMSRLTIEDCTQDFPLLISTQAVMQALVVLIENACDADPSANQVKLDIRIQDQREIVFSVMDKGIGIPDHLRHRIGEPFFTTKKDQTGMGLGLFLVRTLTEHLGGSCKLLPSARGGTNAILTIPVNPKEITE